jgi:hypothetical protein
MADFSTLEQERPKDLRELAYKLSPSWLRGHWGERMVASVAGLMQDVILDGAYVAINIRSLRSPLFPYDGLDLMGHERMLPRFPGEPHASYKTRLLDAWKLWRQAGTAGGIRGMFTRLGFSVSIMRNVDWNWDNQPDNWSRFWVIVSDHNWQWDGNWDSPGTWDDGGTWDTDATPDQVRAVRNIVRSFKAGHEICPAIVIVMNPSAWAAGQPAGTWRWLWNRNLVGATYWDG